MVAALAQTASKAEGLIDPPQSKPWPDAHIIDQSATIFYLRVWEITALYSAGLSLQVSPHKCEHSLFIHMGTIGAGPQCEPRSAGLHACTPQCECTLIDGPAHLHSAQ